MPKPLDVDWPAVRVLAVAVGVREAARQMGISQDAVRQRSKREGWMASPKAVAQRALAKPVTSVSPNVLSPADALANVLNDRKERSKLGLAKYTAEAAEEAALHQDKLGIARNVRDVAAVRSTLWPEDHNERGILNIAFLTGEIPVRAIPPGKEGHVPEVWARDQEEEKSKELPSPVIDCSATDVIADATPVPMQHQGPSAQPAEAVNPPWEEPRESAVIFKCRRGRRG